MEDSTSPLTPSMAPTENPNPNPDFIPKSNHSSRNTIPIGGIPVEFPYQPYGTQLAFMNRVISTLDRSQKEGHCHALLESPTGTGKSLSLLCSAIAWQQHQKLKNIRANLTHSSYRADPKAVTDPINHGGGFIPETQPSGNPVAPAPSTASAKTRLAPVIFYSTRTHAQISQVIREYKKTSYRVPMAVLGSRKRYCTNPYLRGDEKVDEQCRLLLKKNREDTCPEYRNVHKVRGHPSLQKGGCHEVHDIEDLVKIGQVVKGCSYFAARAMAEDADLVFCPYNYIINPIIREGLGVNMNGSIIIFDEAQVYNNVLLGGNALCIAFKAVHLDDKFEIELRTNVNIEDIARDGGSIDLDEDSLLYLQTELGQLSRSDDMTYQPLFEMTQDILSWIEQRKNNLVKRDFQRHFRCWTGDKALKELQEANISLQNFPILLQCAKKAIRIASEAEPDVSHLSGMAISTASKAEPDVSHLSGMAISTASKAEPDVSHLSAMASTVLEGLFSSLNYFFSENGVHAHDFELSLQRSMKKDEGGWTNTFSLWCLNPAVVFKSIAESAQSVILTSGTLSPLNTFSSELGIRFGTCLEAPHIIDVDSQVWAAAISNGPGNYPLNASYKTADEYAFQDAVGTSLEEICKVVPGGCLVFFPSYKLLDKLSTRWQETGQWSRLNAQKSIFVEPRGSSQDSFEDTLKEYYNYIRHGHGTRKFKGKKIRGKMLGLKNSNLVESMKDIKKEGAAFLAVCRGKVSEGMDFSDDNARAVVIVGIPFPNVYDIKVAQKKKFNDVFESSKNLLSGNEWYCQQAFRALNQAAGRCIRHRFDYGAIIFLDERFHKDRNRAHISKWLRKSIRLYSSFEESLDGLKSFFRDVKVHIGITAMPSQDLEVDSENIKPVDKKMETRKKNNKITKSQTRTEVVMIPDDKDASASCAYIDLECNSEKHSRASGALLVESPIDDPELTIVKETPGMNCRGESSPEVYSRDDCSSPQQFSFHPRPVENFLSSPTNRACSEVATPKQEAVSEADIQEPEAESSWSVNCNFRKRRKITSLPSVSHIREFNTPVQVPDKFSSLANSVTTAEATHNTEETYHSKKECVKYKPFLSTPNCSSVSHITSDLNMDEGLQMFCSHCKNPLGLPENDLLVKCSLISTSKDHLMSLQKKTSKPVDLKSSGVDVLVSDTSSVHPHVLKSQESASGQGIWCKEDGCVFNSIFCPFCVNSDNCLGVHVVATDRSNIQFQNKILFYRDCLEIKKFEPEVKKVGTTDEVMSARSGSTLVETPGLNIFEKFAYTSSVQDSAGWKNPKLRMRLPKKV